MIYEHNAENGRRSMMGLSHGEQLVIWGIRKIVLQQRVDPNLPAEFQAAFGCRGEEGLQMFGIFFRLLGQAARRPYEIAPPCTLLVTPDEQRILTLLAAAQLGAASGDHTLFESHLLWLAVCEHRPALCRLTLVFAQLLAVHGHSIAVAQDYPLLQQPEKSARPPRQRMREALSF